MSVDLGRFREKLERELKSGLVAIVLLLALDRVGPEYGYALLKSIAQASAGRFELKEGTAYPVLKSLEEQGLITSFWTGGDGRPRKYYELTPDGRRALRQARQDWEELVEGLRALDDHLGEKRA